MPLCYLRNGNSGDENRNVLFGIGVNFIEVDEFYLLVQLNISVLG
ncbi:hypothetical protein Amet_4137 [Alkaliphilus metalliredigens QYMF]|uniref:Uncharacterized protein n=1 Tax=Alkaliphilus metalliredigens (strain QYMF) TaxID=293826 RepID=A6TVK0_ALKMQ|nr:hypothetical protein Amet_4137 [Alkaliphilus metalliredigens QYMF]